MNIKQDNPNIKTNYIVGHYIRTSTFKDFHIDFTHDDLKTAIESWQHLCRELPLETDVEIRKQTIEVVIAKKVDSAASNLQRFSLIQQMKLYLRNLLEILVDKTHQKNRVRYSPPGLL